jgi:hypothetical protein
MRKEQKTCTKEPELQYPSHVWLSAFVAGADIQTEGREVPFVGRYTV